MGQEDFKKIASQKYKEVTEILSTRLDTKGIYYEAWIDLEEQWNTFYITLQHMTEDDMVEFAANYLKKQDKWYDSPSYVEALDSALEQMPTPCYLTVEERTVIIDALEDKERMLVDHNKTIIMHGIDEQINHYIEKNSKAIEELNKIKGKLKL